MSYLLEKTQDAAVIGPSSATLVRVPDPARFARHKLLVAANRSPQFQNKSEKDRQQAWALLSYLQAERPGDISLAAEQLVQRGKGWSSRLRDQMGRLPGEVPEISAALA